MTVTWLVPELKKNLQNVPSIVGRPENYPVKGAHDQTIEEANDCFKVGDPRYDPSPDKGSAGQKKQIK